MVKYIRIASDATPSTGAGVMVIREAGYTTVYSAYSVPHFYGQDPGIFEIRNAINMMKIYKKQLEYGSIVEFYCDNTNILSYENQYTKIFNHQVEQLEYSHGCVINVHHNTIKRDGNKYVEAANALSRGRVVQCFKILESFGAKPMGLNN